MHCRVIGMICRHYVYARAERVTAGFVEAKQALFRQPGARLTSVTSIIGALDQTADRTAFAAPLTLPPAETLVLGSQAMPQKLRAKVKAIPSKPGVQVRWVLASLGLHEKSAHAISQPVAALPSA